MSDFSSLFVLVPAIVLSDAIVELTPVLEAIVRAERDDAIRFLDGTRPLVFGRNEVAQPLTAYAQSRLLSDTPLLLNTAFAALADDAHVAYAAHMYAVPRRLIATGDDESMSPITHRRVFHSKVDGVP